MAASDWITPDWPAPDTVHAVSTTRNGGVSRGAYASFNLGAHVGDDPRAVAENRLALRSELGLPAEPHWLTQVHGASVVSMPELKGNPLSPAGEGRNLQSPTVNSISTFPTADAAVTCLPGEVCVIMTADCLPVLFCDRAGKTVAAAHAGWRGLAAGVLENTIAAMQVQPEEFLAWLGPAIGPQAYEVGDEVRAAFVRVDREADQAFEPHGEGKWLCDLYQLASQRLRRAGITRIYGGGLCTWSDSERFFSYRRDGRRPLEVPGGGCGRMATLIWRG